MTREEAIEKLDLTEEQAEHFNLTIDQIANVYEISETQAIDVVSDMIHRTRVRARERETTEIVVSIDLQHYKVNESDYQAVCASCAYYYPFIVGWVKDNGTPTEVNETLEDDSN